MKTLALFAVFFSLAGCVTDEGGGRVDTSMGMGLDQTGLACSKGADCAWIGAAGVASALVNMDPKKPNFKAEQRDDSIVLRCLVKRPESDLTFACGPVAVTVQRHGSPTQSVLRFRGNLYALRAASRADTYDLQLNMAGCATPEVIRNARPGEVWTVTFELPCEITPTPENPPADKP